MIVEPIPLMKVVAYHCTLVRKLNRFVVEALLSLRRVRVHNTNTGRLEDLIWEGNEAFCSPKKGGKTSFRLVAAKVKSGGFAVVDTSLQEEAFSKAIEIGLIERFRGCRVTRRRPKLTEGFSDFELSCPQRVIVELKSADLEGPFGEAMWPDCPTERGRRHLRELAKLSKNGVRTSVIFVAGFPGAKLFKPYVKGDPLVLDALIDAARSGVEMSSIGMYFNEFDKKIYLYSDNLPVLLNE